MVAGHTANLTSLMTFNVRGFQIGGISFKRRMKQLYEYLDAEPIDELQLQDVYTYRMLRELRYHLNAAFPCVVYEKGVWGPKAGLVSFCRTAPRKTEFYRLPTSPLGRLDVIGLVPYIHKGVLVTKLESDELRFNLHLDPDHSGEWKADSSASRLIAAQLEEVRRVVMRKRRDGKERIVVVGDFNLPTITPLYSNLLRQLEVADALDGNKHPTFHEAFLPEGRVAQQIDHVLMWPKDVRVTTRLVLDDSRDGVYASDHVGIKVSFRK